MQKKLVQSSLALAAAAALGLGGAMVAGPASAVEQPVLNEQAAVKAAKSVEQVNAFGFDEKTKTLTLGVEAEAEVDVKAIEDLQAKYGAEKVVVEAGVGQLDPRAQNDLVGGAGYLMNVPSAGGGGACSAGFSGWVGDQPVVLTAGHCAEDMSEAGDHLGLTVPTDAEKPSTAPGAGNGGEGFEALGTGDPGEWGFWKFGSPVEVGDTDGNEGDIDFAVLNVDATKYNVKTGITDWTTAASDDLAASTDAITSVGAHTNSGTAKKSGRTTGNTEADVFTEFNDAYEFMNIGGRWVHGFAVLAPLGDPFSAPGDSGGGVYQGDKAVGVISGGGPYSWDNQDWDLSWVADLDYSIQQSGVDFTLEDPNAEPEAPAAPVIEDQTIEPNGAVTGTAEANTDVKISWAPAAGAQAAPEGNEVVTTNAEGAFTIEGPEAEGVYDYTAVATNAGGDSPADTAKVTVEAPAAADSNATDNTNADAAADTADADAAADTADADAAADTADADAGAEGAEADASAAADAKDANADKDGGEAPAERAITIDPKEIVDTDFVNQDKGVTITVEGFEEGENVTLEVVAGPNNVKGIELNEVANADGVAAFSVYGVNSTDPSVYRGTYDVSVTGANDTAEETALTGSFEVVAAEDGNGGGDDLPVTGAELTGLAAGAGLLLVGGAAVVLTMRRNKKN